MTTLTVTVRGQVTLKAEALPDKVLDSPLVGRRQMSGHEKQE